MNPATDIIISVRSTSEFPHVNEEFRNCINTLYIHTHNFRLILIDDNSDAEGSKFIAEVAASHPECILIKTHYQRWFTRAFNLGLRLVRTPYAVCLNCDTVLDTGWLEELYSVKDEVEATVGKVGLVGSIMSTEEPRRYQLSVGQDYVTGHAWLLSMQAIYEASAARGMPGWYLDESKAGCIHIRSDVEICWDLNRLGWQCIKAFKSNVGHIGGRTWGQQLWRLPTSLDAVNERYK